MTEASPMKFHSYRYYYARPLPQPGVHVDNQSEVTWPDNLYATNNYFKPNYYHLNPYLGYVGYPPRVHRDVYKDARHWPAPANGPGCFTSGC